jgi:hypothetical protein
MPSTYSQPYEDRRSRPGRDGAHQWLVTERRGDVVTHHRFYTRAQAEAFAQQGGPTHRAA